MIEVAPPKISIVTPSFNQAPFLEETISSIVGQGYPDLEYVVVDGASTDGSVPIIEKYADRIDWWVSEPDRGHADALRKGFEHTSGEIMAWLNSDDKYTPWCFKVVAEVFQRFPHVDWIMGTHAWWNADGAMVGSARVHKNVYDYLLGDFAWIQQESVFWRRSLWERSGGYIDPTYSLMVDGELWSRFFLHAELYSVDSVLGGYRAHGSNRAAQRYDACIAEMRRAIDVMRHNCSPEVLATAERVRLSRRLDRAVRRRGVSVPPRVRRWLSRGCADAASYADITFQDGQWRERRLPF